MTKEMLDVIKTKYINNDNILQYLKELNAEECNTFEDIMISYDFQAGTYSKKYYENYKDEKYRQYNSAIAETISRYLSKIENAIIFEPGVGEATTMHDILNLIDQTTISEVYGLDASFSRLKYAQKFLKDNQQETEVKFILGDMQNLPMLSDSVDIVYTVHACEPNGGKERELLSELMRVTRRYLILFEPAFDLADYKAKERMIQNGYVTRLNDTILDMGLDVKEHYLLDSSLYELNPTGVTVIEKHVNTSQKKETKGVLACPVSKKEVKLVYNNYWCKDSMLLYPVVDDILCMTAENAIVATKYEEFM